MWSNPRFHVDLVTFTEENFNRKLYFLCTHNCVYLSLSNYIKITKSLTKFKLGISLKKDRATDGNLDG